MTEFARYFLFFDSNVGTPVYRYIDVSSDHLDETLQYINEEKIDMISISSYYGYKLKDIDFIMNIQGLKRIVIGMMDIDIDVSAISKCMSLEFVFLQDVNQALDLSTLPNLRGLSLGWYPSP